MDIVKQMYRMAEIGPMAASQTTKEAITKMMGDVKFKGKKTFINTEGQQEEYNQYAIFSTEFVSFIAINPEGMLEFLTDIWSEKVYENDFKSSGSDYIEGPYITLLGCLVPATLKGYLKQNVLTSGFARRTVMVYGFKGPPVAIPTFTDEQREATRRCIDFLKSVQKRSGKFRFGPGAQEWYVSWYNHLQTNIKDISTPRTESYYTTKHELLFKVAMLLAVSDEGPMFLEIQHFEIANKMFFAPMEENLERVFEGTGINPTSQAAMQICRMLEAMNDPMDKKKLLAMFYDAVPSLRELEDTIRHLTTVGRLEERVIKEGDTILGTVIGTPKSLVGKTALVLARLFRSPSGRQEQ